MKKIITYLYLILNTGIIFSQVRVDTVISVDSVYRHDTLFIYYKKHITYTFVDTNTYYKELQKKFNSKLSPLNQDIKPVRTAYNKDFYSLKTDYFISSGYKFYPKTGESIIPVNNFFVLQGFQVDFRHNNTILTSGFQTENIFFPTRFNKKWNEIFTRNDTLIWFRQKMDIDTIWVLNLDSLVNGDTVYEPHYDTTITRWIDTTNKLFIDTLQIELKAQRINSLHYARIPLIVSKSFIFKKFSLDVQSGIIFQYLINGDYKIMDYVTRRYTTIHTNKFLFTAMAGIRLNYALIPHKLFFFTAINFNYPIISYFSDYQTPPSVGILAGFRINF